MFDYIKGSIVDVRPEGIVLENNGMGYQLLVPNPYKFQVSQEQTTVYTYLHVREDILQLYGFKTIGDRVMFTRLLNVNGIGPKGALAIVASTEPAFLVQAIEEENEHVLLKFPGIGKKTARQMILDLKGKLDDLDFHSAPSLFTPEVESTFASQQELQDAMEALRALGYADKEIKKVEKELRKERLSTEEYIKKALRLLLQR